MKKHEVFPSSFLKAEQLSIGPGAWREVTVTITGIDTSEPFDDGKVQRLLSFAEMHQKLGLNSTNWDQVAYLTGRDDDEEWVGARITLYVDPRVKYAGRTVPAIRIKAPEGGCWPNAQQAKPRETAAQMTAAAQAEGFQPKTYTEQDAINHYKNKYGANAKQHFSDAVASVTNTSGVVRGLFTSAHWAQVIELDEIPF